MFGHHRPDLRAGQLGFQTTSRPFASQATQTWQTATGVPDILEDPQVMVGLCWFIVERPIDMDDIMIDHHFRKALPS